MIINSFYQNIKIVTLSSFFSNFFFFLTFLVNSKSLGFYQFGILSILTTTIVLFTRFFSFDMWQQLFNLGTKYLVNKDYFKFRDIYFFCLKTEITFSIISFIISNIIIYLISLLFRFDEQYFLYAHILTISLIFRFYDTPSGLFRILDKFNYLIFIEILGSLILLIPCLFLFFYNYEFKFYIYVYLFYFSIVSIVANIFAFYLWKKMNFPSLFKSKFLSLKIKKKFISISYTSWISSTLNILQQFDIYLIGYLLGAESSGMFRFASRIASLFSLFSDLLSKVITPKITLLKAQSKINELKKIVVKFFKYSFLIATIIFSISLFVIDYYFYIFKDSEYVYLIDPLKILIFAHCIKSNSFYYRSVITETVGHKYYLKTMLYSFIFLIATFIPLTYYYKLIGSSLGILISSIILYVFSNYIIFNNLRLIKK